MRSLLLAALSLAAVGCSLPGATDAPDAAEQTSSTATAVVVVERTSGPGEAVRGDTLIARFVRVSQGAVDDQVLRMAGASWNLPAVGTCSASVDAVSAASDTQSREVQLLDVGQLTLEDSATKTSLLPRTMFDPTGTLSGVVYSSHSDSAFTAASRLQLRTTGGVDLPEGFSVDVGAPSDVTDVEATPTASGLDITWASVEDAQDLIYVDILSSTGHLVSRCTTTDTGRFSTPNSTDEGQVVVHRLHRESFKTKGIEPGEVRFDVARVVTFKR